MARQQRALLVELGAAGGTDDLVTGSLLGYLDGCGVIEVAGGLDNPIGTREGDRLVPALNR
jgi:hypothetical protein